MRCNLTVIDLKNKGEPKTFMSGKVLPDLPNSIICAFFSPISPTMLYFNDGFDVKSLDLKKPEIKTAIHANNGDSVASALISPSGKTIVFVTQSGEVRLLRVDSGKEELAWKGRPIELTLGFSHDETLLVVGAYDGEISVYSLANKKKIASVSGPRSGFTGIGFLHDNRTVYAIGEYPNVRYWILGKDNSLKERPE